MSLLKPLEQICNDLAGQNYVTASLIYPIVQQLSKRNKDPESSHIFKNIFDNIHNCLSNSLKKRYEDSEILRKITFLDPRFKNSTLNSVNTIKIEMQRIINKVA